jgi:hypothetical protein
MAASAQIESEDVAALRVLKTGERDIRARNIIIDDFRAFKSGETCRPNLLQAMKFLTHD